MSLSCPAEDVISWSVYGGLNEGAPLQECAAPPDQLLAARLPPSSPPAPQLTTSGVPSSNFGGVGAAPEGRIQILLGVLGQIMGEDNWGLPSSSPAFPADSLGGRELLLGLKGPKNIGSEEIEQRGYNGRRQLIPSGGLSEKVGWAKAKAFTNSSDSNSAFERCVKR